MKKLGDKWQLSHCEKRERYIHTYVCSGCMWKNAFQEDWNQGDQLEGIHWSGQEMTVAQIRRVEVEKKKNRCWDSFKDKLAEFVFELIVGHTGNKAIQDNFQSFGLSNWESGDTIYSEEFLGNKKGSVLILLKLPFRYLNMNDIYLHECIFPGQLLKLLFPMWYLKPWYWVGIPGESVEIKLGETQE